ncbi:hypothetical protein CWI38_0067p0010, partial [Hamiltosporidium tvaerminnensis]
LKEIKVYRINFQNMSFSELFCASKEYKIERMEFSKINISEKDLIFIANLKKIEDILFRSCDIQGKAYHWIKFLFYNKGYIELKYMFEADNLAAETIKFIEEKFNTNILLQSRGS